jgi:hypothetical protein
MNVDDPFADIPLASEANSDDPFADIPLASRGK